MRLVSLRAKRKGVSLEATVKLAERISSKVLRSPKSTSASSSSSTSARSSVPLAGFGSKVFAWVDPEIIMVGIERSPLEGWSITSLSLSSTNTTSFYIAGDTTLSSLWRFFCLELVLISACSSSPRSTSSP